ncbi:MAG: SdrD B-like domain-containing protein [Saprospiraceae bacterium]|nr:SdrD B-like domain-containing protein [Saprospiraceae bacterium]
MSTKKTGFLLAFLGLFFANFSLNGLNIHMDYSSEETPACFSSLLDSSQKDLLQNDHINMEFFFMGDDNGCCDQGSGKPQKITMRYTGEDCSASNNSQDSDKVNCSGNPNGAGSVYIIANDQEDNNGGDVWFSGTVALDGTFTLDANNAGEDKFGSKTFVHIYNSQGGSSIQEIEFHTSCSQPLFLGDQYGSLTLEGIIFPDGYSCNSTQTDDCPEPSLNISTTVVCPKEAVVFSTDDLGFPCFSYSWNFGSDANPPVATGIGPHSVVFSGLGAYQVSLTVDNGCEDPGSGSGSSGSSGSGGSGSGGSGSGSSGSGGTICGDGVSNGSGSGSSGSSGSGGSGSGSNSDSCCDEIGKPSKITMKYTGEGCDASSTSQSSDKWSCSGNANNDGSVYIVASSKEDGDGDIWFSGTVALSENYLIDAANAGEDKLSSEMHIQIYSSQGGSLLQEVEFHASCSEPLDIGNQWGANLLMELENKDGEKCNDSPSSGSGCIDCRQTVSATVLVTEDCEPEECPDPEINIPTDVCAGESVTFSAPDLGFTCLTYSWTFGAGATPPVASGIGPHTVTYASSGTVQVSLTIDNGCDGDDGNGDGNGSGSSGSSGSGSSGSSGSGGSGGSGSGSSGSSGSGSSGSSTGNGGPVGPGVICPDEGNGGSNGSGSGSSGSSGSGGSGSGSSGSSGSGSNNGDCCDEIGKPTIVTLRYTGENCDATNTDQDSDKWSCSGNTNGAPSVYIIAGDEEDGDGDIWFSGTVALNDTYEIDAGNAGEDKLSSRTFVSIYSAQGGSLLQSIEFHTSCSQPLSSGSQWGANQLVSIADNDGASCDVNPDDPTGSGNQPCIECRKTITIDIEVEEDCTQDLGKIGDRVWFDNNSNGIQDVDANGEFTEDGIAFVWVLLFECDDLVNPIAFDVTDLNGIYMFNDLEEGCYKVRFANPGLAMSPENVGDDCADSDQDFMGFSEEINLGAGEENLCIDAGFIPNKPECHITGVASNIVCDDNGTPGPGDDTFTFDLLVTGTATGSGWTTSILGETIEGNYNETINLGSYPIIAGVLNFVIEDKDDSNCNVSVAVIPPAPCSEDDAPAKLGDTVWNDINQDGTLNNGEPGVPNVKVTLRKCDGTFVGEKDTDDNGKYLFEDLAPNMEYFVVFDLPATFEFTTQNVGNDGLDSDADPDNGQTACVELLPGDDNRTVDAGLIQVEIPAKLGDKVFNDENKNGLQDAGEEGVPGVTVTLTKCDGTSEVEQTTDSNGEYLFENLAPNMSYKVSFTDLPDNFVFTTANTGDDDGLDSDADPDNGQTACVTLTPGEDNRTVDAGIFEVIDDTPAKLGDKVFNDENKNGLQDAGEEGVPGVTVTLTKCDGTSEVEQTTDSNGEYLFENLAPNMSYKVSFTDLPDNFVFTTANTGDDDGLDSDADPDNGQTACVTLTPGEDNRTVDAGIYENGTTKIGDFVWDDLNGDGIQDPDEPGIPGVYVVLENCQNGFIDFRITDADGMYMYNDLAPGEYQIRFANPGGGYQTSPGLQGGDDEKDSNITGLWDGRTDCFTVVQGVTDLSIDAGFTKKDPSCNINVVATQINCEDNGTPNDPSDDIFTFNLKVTGAYTGNSGWEIIGDGTSYSYGQTILVGPYQISSGSVTIDVRDVEKNDCFASITVDAPDKCSDGGCDNVTDGGTIEEDESNCEGYDPEVIVEVTPPVGGTGALEYLWLQSTTGCPTSLTQQIPGATSASYDPPFISETTWFIRCVRRVGCVDWTIGESNCVKKEVETDCDDCDNVTSGGTIAGDESNCGGFDPAPMVQVNPPIGGTGALEYLWLKSTTGCPTSLTQQIPSASSASYDPPFISETTWYIRCVRRAGCTDWTIGESNCIKKEVITNCGSTTHTIGNYVWSDDNGNGIQDDEDGIDGVWIFLQNQAGIIVPGGVTVSKNGGQYEFTDVPSGTYRIKFANPGSYYPSPQDAGNDDSVDSDINYLSGTTEYFLLSGDNFTIDAGFVPVSHANVLGNDDETIQNQEVESVITKQNSTSPTGQVLTHTHLKTIQLFPNPASGHVEINLGTVSVNIASVEIFNSLGQQMRKVDFEDNSRNVYIELDNLQNGQYWVRITLDESEVITKTLIIQNR